MTSAERKLLLPFLRDVAKVPHVVLARRAEVLIEKFGAKRPMAKAIAAYREAKAVLKQEWLSKREHRAQVRAACVKRANGYCECGCGRAFLAFGEHTAEWDEFYGRKHVTVEETWMLTRDCHRRKTENNPTRHRWDRAFANHCARHGYQFTPRLIKEAA